MKKIKIRLKELREEADIDQKVLAIELNVSQPTVSDWENNRKTPSIENIVQLADYFHVSIDYLIFRSDSRHAEFVYSDCWNGQPIRDLREQWNETPEETAKCIGIPVSNYIKYENAILDPPISVLFKLADHFRSDIDFLLGYRWGIWENGQFVVGDFRIRSKEEQEIIEHYRLLLPEKKGKVIGYIDGLLETDSSQAKSPANAG